jgi:hypothetical protein
MRMDLKKLEKKAVTKQVAMGIAYRTAALVAFIVVIVFLFSGQAPIKAVSGFSFLFMPLLVGAILLYVALLPGLLLGGEMAAPLSRGLISLAAAVLLSLIASGIGLDIVSTPLLIFGFMVTIHFLSGAYSEITGIISRAGVIVTAGFLAQAALNTLNNDIMARAGNIIMVSAAVLAVLSLPGMLKGHSNAYITYIGTALSNIKNLAVVFAAAALVMIYFVFLRPLIVAYASGWLIAVEWLIMCAIVVLLFLKARSYVDTNSELQGFGDGHAVACKICYDKESLESASAMIRDYVEGGKKEGLIALVAATMVNNGAPLEEVMRVLAIVIDHKDDPAPLLIFKWALGDLEEARRKKRLMAVNEMIDAAAKAIKTGAPDSKKSEAGQEAKTPAPAI